MWHGGTEAKDSLCDARLTLWHASHLPGLIEMYFQIYRCCRERMVYHWEPPWFLGTFRWCLRLTSYFWGYKRREMTLWPSRVSFARQTVTHNLLLHPFRENSAFSIYPHNGKAMSGWVGEGTVKEEAKTFSSSWGSIASLGEMGKS